MLCEVGPAALAHGVRGWHQWKKSESPSGGGSKWFAEPGVPLHIMSMPILPSAIRLYAALKHAFRNWPKGDPGLEDR